MMKLNDNVTRLISAKASQVSTYNGRQLKEAIFKSEGRVLMGQTYLKNPILFPNSTGLLFTTFNKGKITIVISPSNSFRVVWNSTLSRVTSNKAFTAFSIAGVRICGNVILSIVFKAAKIVILGEFENWEIR